MDVELGPFIHDPRDFDNPEKISEHKKQLSYYFWTKAGCPEGQSDRFWKMAEDDVIKQKAAFDDMPAILSALSERRVTDSSGRIVIDTSDLSETIEVQLPSQEWTSHPAIASSWY